MAKKKAVRAKTTRTSAAKATADPAVDSASDALRAAQEELRKAEALYQRAAEQASEKIEEIRDTTIGDVWDGAMDIVRKHPGPSLLAALVAGVMLDRWLRK